MRTLLMPLALAALLALAACETSEERAEAHYQSAMALLAEGDTARAEVELRNVFRLDGDHTRARLEYAAILRDRGEVREALAQYLRLVEQDPTSAVGHRELTDLALRVQDFETARIHAARAFRLDPEDPGIRALKATVDFRDPDLRDTAVEMAQGALDAAPDNVAAHMVVIADRLANGETEEALARIDTALAAIPGDEGLHLVRLATLERLGDMTQVGDELHRMAELFPDNTGVRDALIQWHLRAGDTPAAEAVLRETAARDPQNPAPALTVVQFLLELRGAEAARTELEALIAAQDDPRPFQRALARLDFAQGRPDEAIAALEALLVEAEPSDATRDLQTTLAQMLAETGADARGATLVDAVLAGDPAHVDALKLRARAAIAGDRPEVAIQDMRTALTQAPRDPEIMTIMALAHEREGARELMGERLALAVEVSNRGVAGTLR